MADYSIEHDHISISELDTRILVVLLAGQNGGYGIARQCEIIARDDRKVYPKNVYQAIDKLAAHQLVKREAITHPADARQKSLYAITALGRELLDLKLSAYRRLITTAAKYS